MGKYTGATQLRLHDNYSFAIMFPDFSVALFSTREPRYETRTSEEIQNSPLPELRRPGGHPIFGRRRYSPYIARFGQSQAEQPRFLILPERDAVHDPSRDIGF